ncbi:MAG TPA: hypothetical protein VME01_02410, partial [Solirubrobacteraceae bacterium]|nr:hypothetical protein [Solirubrobacteraceae bacterium]
SSERLPADWSVSGTVGYEFLNDVCGLFIDPAAEPSFTGLWQQLSGDTRPFGAYALEAKLEQARTTFTPELERLARAADAQGGPAESTEALALALSTLPVYRTYDPLCAGEFITRFQQTSPAIMAKGVEDTAFYRYSRLLALNDVGGDPGRFGIDVTEFHAANAERAVRHPEALLSTMTHDAKRSTDVRARMTALTQIPEQWTTAARRWLELSERHCRELQGAPAPDLPERYFILQTLAGAWPIEPERLDGYLEKALREAKRHTSWVDQDEDYEQAVKDYARALVQDPEFRDEFEPFVTSLAHSGARLVLAQMVLKLTSPGVPDTYQGDEFELRALVDPDNRRPVDWDLRRTRLDRFLGGGHPGSDLGDRKLWTMARLLGLRARLPRAFAAGPASYQPLDGGPSTCAFVRGGEVLSVVALPRAGSEADPLVNDLPGGRWREVFSGEERTFERRMPRSRLISAESGLAVYERL